MHLFRSSLAAFVLACATSTTFAGLIYRDENGMVVARGGHPHPSHPQSHPGPASSSSSSLSSSTSTVSTSSSHPHPSHSSSSSSSSTSSTHPHPSHSSTASTSTSSSPSSTSTSSAHESSSTASGSTSVAHPHPSHSSSQTGSTSTAHPHPSPSSSGGAGSTSTAHPHPSPSSSSSTQSHPSPSSTGSTGSTTSTSASQSSTASTSASQTSTATTSASQTSTATTETGQSSTATTSADETSTATTSAGQTLTATTTTATETTSTSSASSTATSCAEPTGILWAYHETPEFSAGGSVNPSDYDVTVVKGRQPSDQSSIQAIGIVTPGDTETIYGSSTSVQTDHYILEHKTYFEASESGEFTFTLDNCDNVGYLWFGETAYSGWDDTNYDAQCNYGTQSSASFTTELEAREFYPLRVLLLNNGGPASFSFSVSLDGSTVDYSQYTHPHGACPGDDAPEFEAWGSES